MRHAGRILASGLVVAAGLLVVSWTRPLRAAADTLPVSLSDQDFWALNQRMSEPAGYFPSDNLTSNESNLSTVAAALAQRVAPGGVYLGVGPEQNLTYIAASRPRIAFITDIRRGNLYVHLMYKALLELSSDRADFLSRLFTKKRPAGLSERSSAADLVSAYWSVLTDDEQAYRINFQAVIDLLTKTHALPLSFDDVNGIDHVYHAFFWNGLLLNYDSLSTGPVAKAVVNYASLMTSLDSVSREERSFLSSEDGFRFLQSLERKNLIVPVVGDFGGSTALRAVGAYVRDHGAVITAFYVSNVERYLFQDSKYPAFCANVASMPLDDTSVFIRPGGPPAHLLSSTGLTMMEREIAAMTPLGSIAHEVARCK